MNIKKKSGSRNSLSKQMRVFSPQSILMPKFDLPALETFEKIFRFGNQIRFLNFRVRDIYSNPEPCFSIQLCILTKTYKQKFNISVHRKIASEKFRTNFEITTA